MDVEVKGEKYIEMYYKRVKEAVQSLGKISFGKIKKA